MDKISKSQLTAMLLIGDVFALFCLSGSLSAITTLGFLAGTALQFLLTLPFAFLCKKDSSMGKPAEAIMLVWLIFWGGTLFRMQWSASEVIYIPYENSGGIFGKLLISGLIALVCLYISSIGLKALSRASVIAAAVGAVGLAVVIVSAVFSFDPENFYRAKAERSFFSEIIRGFSLSGGLGSLIVLLTLTKSSPASGTSLYFIGKGIVTAAMTLTTVFVAGGIMKITDFPVITVAQLSQPFSVQRIDSLFLINFTVFAVFSIAVQSAAAAYLAGEIFPKFKRYRCSAVLLLMIASAFLIPGNELLIAAATAAVLIAVPAIISVQRGFTSRRRQS